MKNKTTRFLQLSLFLVAVLCILAFSCLAFYMNNRSAEAINEIGTLYMSSMSEQVSLHFETTIELRLSQVRALADTISPDTTGLDQMWEQLKFHAQARSFSYLGLCAPDGRFEMIYGSPTHATDPEPFLDSLNHDEAKVAVGSDAEGNAIVLFGIPAEYPMSNGTMSCALVGGIPAESLSETLSLDENDEKLYSFIIRQDGSFVIRPANVSWDNYFDRVYDVYEQLDQKAFVEELTAAMYGRNDYTREVTIDGERRYLYCTSLADSEWHLLTFMPCGTLDNVISELSGQWIRMVLGSCTIVLAALLLVFVQYFRLTHQQIVELENAKRTAESAQQAAEEAQQAAENANKAKSEFLSNMSHDIRTPMNAVVGMTAIATANIDNREQVQNCLRKIALSSKHLLGLINDVLDMSKIESGKMTLNFDQISLREVIEGIVNIVQPQVKAKHQQFGVSIYNISTENICCDSVRLNQVLLNIISNAVKFTPEGGTIEVAVHEEESPKGEDYVRIKFMVKDTGIGMSPEFKAKIFESFTREDSTRVNRTEGTGLGMAITKYIVDAMEGDIQVESEQGKGSEFNVTLDMQKALVQEVDMILPNWNMLVVDDDRLLCENTTKVLASIGVKAEWAMDGETALRMVEERYRKHDNYQVILLDWKLPGMDGIETAHAIRKLMGNDIPILLISAYDWSDIEQDARDAGVNGFICKPLFKSTLFYGLRRFVEADDEQDEAPISEADLSGKRVLLAEDNELNWEIAEELLAPLGLELEWAQDGQICLEKFRASAEGFYDAILMDLRMPQMNGYEAAQYIRASGRFDADIPIIAMTADAFAEDIERCLECGMNAHIAKPIDMREVSRLLMKYIK